MTNRIRVLRAEHNWTQAQLADKVRVSRQAIIAIENGKFEPGLSLAMRIARAFKSRVEDVFTLED
ncbi:MAG TPA: helix-turn-helix transcriptional regulator [Vicinamibacterales bacterium]|nr:helix-turn-helix transcriptional regulator [Vicinamibacterales bacterium]